MSDLISRKEAIEALHKKCVTEGSLDEFDIEDTLRKLQPAEPERTAKVIDKSVDRHFISDFDWTGKCEKCRNEIQYEFYYCPYCGSRLEWDE